MATEEVGFWSQIWTIAGVHYGNVASVIGLVIALEGFRRTLIGVREAKEAANDAKREAALAVDRVGSQILLNEITSSIKLLEELLAMNRSRNWELAIDRCEQLRGTLSRMVEHTRLNDDERFKVASGIDDLRDVLPYLERLCRANSTKQITQAMHTALHELLVTLNRLAGKLRNLNLEVTHG